MFSDERLKTIKGNYKTGLSAVMQLTPIRYEYLKNFHEWRDNIKRRAEDLRIDYVPLRTDEPVDRALGHYLAFFMQMRPALYVALIALSPLILLIDKILPAQRFQWSRPAINPSVVGAPQ